ncbi:hypothetical protein ACIQUQ_04720 [Streptomyces sp. NPDC101118]|uniref:hypothetical protein n=1 Tax=Streptomyces sp. NPDC101118 TaxID=3366109 RepID=UPI003828A990
MTRLTARTAAALTLAAAVTVLTLPVAQARPMPTCPNCINVQPVSSEDGGRWGTMRTADASPDGWGQDFPDGESGPPPAT